MTYRIFGKKLGHMRTPSEKTGEKLTPRATQLSKEAKKRHTRLPSLSRQEIGRPSWRDDSEIPATPRKPDDQDLADDAGSHSEVEPNRTVDFEIDSMKLPTNMPPLPGIPIDLALKWERFKAKRAFRTDLRAVKTGDEITPRTSWETTRQSRLPGVAKKPKPLPALPPGSPRSSVKKSAKPLPTPPTSPRAKPQEKPLASSSSEKKS